MPESTFRGEEGLLYRIPSLVEPYDLWVKKWYRSNGKGFSVPIETGVAILSPYWARLKELEVILINALFPDCTVKMEGSYDERVSANHFDIFSGRPATITRHVEAGDNVLFEALSLILEEAYKVILEHGDKMARRAIETAREVPGHAEFIQDWRRNVDDQIRKLLGPDLDMGAPLDFDQVSARTEELRKRNPNTTIVDLLDAGIVPVHPQVNFIPGNKETHPKSPHGTFLEFMIYDEQKLYAAAKKKFASSEEELGKFFVGLKELLVLERLDLMYDDIVMYSNFGNLDQEKYTAQFQSAFFLLLNEIGACLAEKRLTSADLHRLASHMRSTITLCGSLEEMVQIIKHTELIVSRGAAH